MQESYAGGVVGGGWEVALRVRLIQVDFYSGTLGTSVECGRQSERKIMIEQVCPTGHDY